MSPPPAGTTASPRPWHVSDAHLARPEAASDGSGPTEPDDAPEPDRSASPPPAELAPLWYRLVTGRSFGYRLRRQSRRFRRARRQAAQLTLSRLTMDPEPRRVAHAGQPLRYAALLLGPRGRALESRPLLYRPTVRVGATVTGPSSSRLFTDASVQTVGGTGTSMTIGRDGRMLAVGGASGSPVRVLDPVDLRVWSPVGLPSRAASKGLPVGDVIDDRDERKARRMGALARACRVVDCSPDTSYSPEYLGSCIARLAAAGTPLVGAVSEPVRAVIGDALADTIQATDPSLPRSGPERALASLRIRRCALSELSPRGVWRRIGDECGLDVASTPQVSVLLPSNRPADVIEATRQVAAQRNVDVQLVVGLHGEHMPSALEDELGAVFSGELVVRRLPSDRNLGQVMGALTEPADRPLVTKWDDDDWYDADHLADLVLAMEYSGAAMVGKAAEFVYLEELDVTLHRWSAGAERHTSTIAGGTLMMRRQELREIGWAEVPRRVDGHLIEAFQRRGHAIYRTHGFGYVLRRSTPRGASHTWDIGDDYFLRAFDQQHHGLALAAAGFDLTARP